MIDSGQDKTLQGIFLRRGLGRKLLLRFLALALVPLMLVSVISYVNANESLREAAMSRLRATSELKTAFIKNWFSYRFLDLESQAISTENARFLTELSEAFRTSGKEIEDFVGSYRWAEFVDERGADLKTFRRTYGYHDVFLVDSEGNILFSVIGEPDLGTNLFDGPYSETLFAKVCKKTLETGQPGFSDFEMYAPSDNAVAGFLTSLIVNDKDGEKLVTTSRAGGLRKAPKRGRPAEG